MELIDTGLTLKEREHMRMRLEDGEEVLWMARPLIPWWSSAILPVGIFGLVWCGMLTKMCSCGADWGMLPFVLVGVALLVAPFLIYRYHKHSAYVLTNKYAHILRPGLTGKVSSTSYPAGSNMVVKTEANLNDTGSLIFGYNTVSAKHGTKQQPYGFLLTRKLAEAERIIEEGRQKAADIVNEAKKQAEALLAQAKKQAVEVDTNTKNELKLYTNQALNALKSEVANVLTCQVVKKTVGDLVADKEFLGQFAVALAQKWVENEPVVISTEEADSLKAYFAAHAKELLDKGVTINKVNGKETLFTISPADGSYKVNFGKEEFETYFKEFLRPQMIEMLF